MANFYSFLPLLQQAEGGYQNNPKDSGNYNSKKQLVGTNWGISAKTYEEWIGKPPTILDMKNMPKNTAIQIYKLWYWQRLKADLIVNQSIANIFVDHGVNAGTCTASKMVQSILKNKFNKNIAIDCVIGNITLNAMNTVNQEQLHAFIKEERASFYKKLGSSFLAGWLNRLNFFFFKKPLK
jgi:lysozyme family protein